MEEPKKQATRKWREYVQATKISSDPIYKDLAKVYNQLKGGRKVIDIGKVIIKGGVNDWNQPNLAIAKAQTKEVFCSYYESGTCNFVNRVEGSWTSNARHPIAEDVIITGMPTFSCKDLIAKGKLQKDRDWRRMEIAAPVPLIPPRLLPTDLATGNYYILWEVEEWRPVPPVDPWLLKRITSNLFVAVAGWDLTKIERAAMAGRMS